MRLSPCFDKKFEQNVFTRESQVSVLNVSSLAGVMSKKKTTQKTKQGLDTNMDKSFGFGRQDSVSASCEKIGNLHHQKQFVHEA